MTSTRVTDLIINDGTNTTAPTKSLELQNSISSIVLGNNINTTPVFTTISPTAITQGANSISLQNLTLLPTVLAAVELPPNATTLKLNDTILLDNGSADTLTLNTTSITAPNNISLISSSLLGDINLDAPNIDTFNYAMPICFEVRDSGTINYGGGQPLTNVFVTNANVPPNFFVENPTSGYTSTIWRIDFTLQTWNAGGQNNSSDKALAYYIDFNDQSSTFYVPYIFDATTPYCKSNNNSTWTAGGSNSEFQSHTWTDYVDFFGLVSTGSGNLPLKFNLYMGSDNPKDFTFKLLCSLTRTNLLPP
jgi:hypothetical protein